jgi:hypothetical protein
MNFTVGLRTAPIQTLLFSAPFYVPAILVGIPAFPFFVANGLMNSLQLLVHTELNWNPNGRLRFLGFIFNTPSHHCVHHGSQDQYLDKNFGAVFIVWDRIFGTFVPQVEKVVYGARRPLPTLNPIRALFDEYRYLVKAGRVLKSPMIGIDKELRDEKSAPPGEIGKRWKLRVRETLLSLSVTFAAFFILLYHEPKPSAPLLFLWASLIVLGIFVAGEWLDYSPKARAFERLRSVLLLAIGLFMYYFAPSANGLPVLLIFSAASICAYISIPRRTEDFKILSVA